MKKNRLLIFTMIFIIVLFSVFSISYSQTYKKIADQVKTIMLKNGMKFIVLERHDAPVVSFHTYADVGSSQEVDGITGISHILEHMAFKGTTTVGTKDFEKEKRLLDEMDNIYLKLQLEENAIKIDSTKINSMRAEFEKIKKSAFEYIVSNEYFDLVNRQGGSGTNAYTSNDATQYIVSLPSNKLEFWMALESDRFLNPVFRQFFEERNVIMEERRLGLETQPTGKLLEDFFASAFKAHPYHHSVVGNMSDLRNINRNDVYDYFKKYYSPSNLVVAIVGDVNSVEVFKLAEEYFERIPSGKKPDGIRTEEPEQWGERKVIVEAQSQPIVILGYHRPSVLSKEDLAFEALANILGQGRSSRLYNVLVKEKKIAISTGVFNGFPGNKYPNLLAIYAIPAKDHSNEECLKEINSEIEKIKNEPVTTDELTKFKRQNKISYFSGLKSNSSLAASLTFYEVVKGNWRETFDYIDNLESIHSKDIQAIARKYLVNRNRTIGELIPEKK